MILNPNNTQLQSVPGTRILSDDYGLAGFQYTEPSNPLRLWTLQYLLAPLSGRALGGIRARFLDEKGYVTFLNQRDLEVIAGIAQPGDDCLWLGEPYPGPDDDEWFGFCVDTQDLNDDLHDRELRIREAYPNMILPSGIEIARRVHSGKSDWEELHTMLWDVDVETGFGPDTRLDTVESRWSRIEKVPLPWKIADL